MNSNIIIASKNPVKINAVSLAFKEMFPNTHYNYEGVSVPSNVREQPMSNAETLQGAINRATNAKQEYPNATFWVGIEGGIEATSHGMESFAWVVVQSKEKQGQSKTNTFMLPQKVSELVHQGYELGDADDIVFGASNSKQKNGAVGLLTGNAMDRTELYRQAVVLALIPFINKDLY